MPQYSSDPSITLTPCDPIPEVVGSTPFETLINGQRINTHEYKFSETDILHVPRGISWHPKGWLVRCERNGAKEEVSLINCSEDNRITELQTAWERLRHAVERMGPRDRYRSRHNILDTGVTGVGCSLYARGTCAYLKLSVNFPQSRNRTFQIHKTIGNVMAISEERFRAQLRRAISLRKFAESCMRDRGMFVDDISWDANIPLIPELKTFTPALMPIRREAVKRYKILLADLSGEHSL